jgi:hypothetical protein
MGSFREAVIDDLRRLSPQNFVSTHIFDRSPYAFASRDDFVHWKGDLSNGIGVDAASLTVVGSSAVGVSLHPNKNFKTYDLSSDVDVAVISHYHFQVAWRFLRNNAGKRYKLAERQRAAWDEHVTGLVYWGAIATDRLLPLFPFASDWLPAVSRASTPLIGDRPVNLRIYADYESLRSYQIKSVRTVRDALLQGLSVK